MDYTENQAKAEALYKQQSQYVSVHSIKGYEDVLELNPKHILALWTLGCIYAGDEDHDGHGSYWDELYLANEAKAIDCFKKIIDIDPNYSKAYLRLGRLSPNKEKALQYFLQYLNQKPQDYSAIASIGNIYYHLNKKQEATYYFTRCIEHNQKVQSALYGLAKIYEEQGNLKSALQCLNKSIEIHNRRADTHANIARIYDKMGNTQEAINSYRKCNQFNSNHKQAQAYLIKHAKKGLKH